MKILHFILGKANPDRANGVNHVIHGLSKYSTLAGHQVQVVGLSKGMKESYQLVQRDSFQVEVYNSFFGACFNDLKGKAAQADIVHLHSVWQNYNIIFARYLRSIGKPYVITVHSGLTQDRITQSRYWLKLLYHTCFQKRMFNGAGGIHAITREEITDIAKHTKQENIFFVPNGIDLDNHALNPKSYAKETVIIKFGYLGRFGKEKNINNLIVAISKLPKSYLERIKCRLIGPLDENTKTLQLLVNKLELQDIVEFTGPLYGTKKYNALNDLDFYIHPAYSDVVSIAVMEAMASGLPCVITRTSQVSYYYNSNAFVMVEPLDFDIKRGLIEMIDNQDAWSEMSNRSIQLISDSFNWKSAVELLVAAYSSIIS